MINLIDMYNGNKVMITSFWLVFPKLTFTLKTESVYIFYTNNGKQSKESSEKVSKLILRPDFMDCSTDKQQECGIHQAHTSSVSPLGIPFREKKVSATVLVRPYVGFLILSSRASSNFHPYSHELTTG